jgi:hypothetical protein
MKIYIGGDGGYDTHFADIGTIRILTPIIGELVYLNDSTQQFTLWWRK